MNEQSNVMIQGVEDAQPPSMVEKESPGDGEPPNRDNRKPNYFLFGNILGRGQLLSRGLSLLNFYSAMGGK